VIVLTEVINPGLSRVDETPAFRAEEEHQGIPKAPIVQVLRESPANVARAVCMAFANVIGTTTAVFGAAYATQAAYGIGMSTTTANARRRRVRRLIRYL
jgi:hypothetical protein